MNTANSAIVSFGDIRVQQPGASGSQITSITCENFRNVDPHELKRQGVTTIVVPSAFRPLVDDQTLIRCRTAGIKVLNEIEFREMSSKSIDIDLLSNGWLAYGDTLGGGAARRMIERGFDILLSLLILIAAAPVLLATAALIKLDSEGPIFYRQTRVGLFGQTFEIVKFRSMQVDAEQAGAPVWATKRDPRVTRLGAILRLLRIDELPQLFNVLKGEMSVIGPRPERPHFVDDLASQIPHYRDRAVAKPGITGWAQVNYPYGASVEDARRKLAYDLYYIKHRSLMMDVRICIATIRVIILREGAR
jgi:exopolysaccharide biosynthesis polyprenyl glycosylphosphotransferase